MSDSNETVEVVASAAMTNDCVPKTARKNATIKPTLRDSSSRKGTFRRQIGAKGEFWFVAGTEALIHNFSLHQAKLIADFNDRIKLILSDLTTIRNRKKKFPFPKDAVADAILADCV